MPDFVAVTAAITSVIGGAVTVAGVIITGLKAKQDKDMGVSTEERQTRRDTVADRDALIDQIQEEQARMRDRVSVLEAELHNERNLLYHERDYVRVLIDHIYRGQPPPPPSRPDLIERTG